MFIRFIKGRFFLRVLFFKYVCIDNVIRDVYYCCFWKLKVKVGILEDIYKVV